MRSGVRLAAFLLIALLVACAGGVKGVNMQSDSAAFSQTPPSGQFITVDGTKVHYQIEGSGPDLILIHGAGGSLRDFTFHITDQLTDDFRVILFDRPGHGYTDRIADRRGLGESPQEQAALLSRAARELGVNDAVVLGHSYGGAVALAWTLDHPEDLRALVTVAGVSNEWEGGLGAWYSVTNSWLGRNLLIPVISAAASRERLEGTTRAIFEPDPVPQGYLDHMGAELSKSATVLRSTTQQVNGLKPHIIEMEPRYPGISVPVEIVHGDKDTSVPLAIHGQVLSDQIDGANLTVLPGIGHMPHHADPAAVLGAIRRAADRAGLL